MNLIENRPTIASRLHELTGESSNELASIYVQLQSHQLLKLLEGYIGLRIGLQTALLVITGLKNFATSVAENFPIGRDIRTFRQDACQSSTFHTT